MSSVGTVTSLDDHRLARARGTMRVDQLLPRATLYFDLRSPYTYFVAERADRLFDGLQWRPASADVLHGGELEDDAPRAAADRAGLLGLPLVWPEDRPYRVPRAMRVASLAAERGCGGAFVLAASRLAFCGGFDLDDPEVLAEAAAAAGIPLDACLEAARDPARDGSLEAAARRLLAAGAERLPVVRVGRVLYAGEQGVAQAAAVRRTPVRRAGLA
jgi:2-hydroxychromene-2-carboxylate isomerase